MKSVPTLFPPINDVTGQNAFATSALSDIVADWLDEIDTVYKFGTMSVVLTQTSAGAERTACAT